MSDPEGALRRDVSDLGRILGDVLVEQEGLALFELEEKIRALAKERRKHHRRGAAAARMEAEIARLAPLEAERVARAFTHYFQLVNLAEQHHRTRRRRDYAREGRTQPGSFLHELGRLAKIVPRERFLEVLGRTRIELVFTAHPSEAQRRTVLEKHRRIAQLLARRDRVELVPDERAELDRALREEVTTLWQTDEIRSEKPRVGDEVKNTLFYLEEVLFPLVPRFYDALERAVREAYGADVVVPSILKFGSWVGADMDGNPNVTPEVALDTAYAQAARVVALYQREVVRLGETLSQSTRRVRVTDELLASIARDAEDLSSLAGRIEPATRDEPYRRKLRFVEARLASRHAALVTAREESRRDHEVHLWLRKEAYADPRALLGDLEVIARSLAASRGERAGLRQVRALIRQVETFGFHLAKLDVRVPAAWAREAAKAAAGSPRRPPDAAGMHAMRALARVRSVTAGGGAESFILSMARGKDDMLATLELASLAGVYRPDEGVADVSVVPLFETLDDLRRCAGEIERAAGDPAYARYLDLRSRTQEIMLGYSDSNKDAGILASSFALYRAQQELVRVAKRKGLRLVVFHGRGGSIGRGGGPSQRAIESLPAGSIDGRFKLTEQGEVLGWKYLLSEIAERNLEITASGVLRASSEDPTAEGDLREYEEAFEEIAETSLAAYRALVHDEGFVRYYEASTPLEEIGMLNIGSRPARRGQTVRKLEDLRAIPWVFAWTQSRQMVPGWFGAGAALRALLRTRGLPFARRMRETWRFFQTTIDAVAVSLATADMDIAQRYASLVPDRAVARRLFGRIALDHGRAVRAVAAILEGDLPTAAPSAQTGEASALARVLAQQPTLARSIALRNPYVDPLSFIQVEMLRRKRNERGGAPPHELERTVLLTINGIAAGLRNTG
jgi:phosphoenolpyruvate carboxylase